MRRVGAGAGDVDIHRREERCSLLREDFNFGTFDKGKDAEASVGDDETNEGECHD